MLSYISRRRGIWDSISLKTDKPVWLTSIGVFTPSGHTAVSVAARPIKDDLDHIDVSAQLKSIYEQEGATMSLFGNGMYKGTIEIRKLTHFRNIYQF